jgi:hypothetical protein
MEKTRQSMKKEVRHGLNVCIIQKKRKENGEKADLKK